MKKINLILFLSFFIFKINSLPAQTNTNEISIEKAGITFTFSFNCNGGPCEYGQFATGDYWVAPNTPNGTVTITGISPNEEKHGAMVNPDLLRDNNGNIVNSDNQRQGFLNSYTLFYENSLNLMTKLPYSAKGGESIFKIKAMDNPAACGTKSIQTYGCVESAVVLTVLSNIPNNRGDNMFRPPFHGNSKPIYTTDKVMMNRLPKLPQATGLLKDLTNIEDKDSYKKWLVPQIDLYSKYPGPENVEFMRATIPHAAQPSYSAGQAFELFHNMFSVFGEETNEEKKDAVYALIQKGIDNYGIFKMGVPFSSGAGQFLGKKPPIAFLAAMYNDTAILEDVRRIASDPKLLNELWFQADSQIRMGKSGMAIWGQATTGLDIHTYFGNLYPNRDNSGTLGDPYGYIDGPAGGYRPELISTGAREYLGVTSGPHIGYAFLQHLMPWFKYAANDYEILNFADRIYDGYGIDNFDGGFWTLPDPVAPKATEDHSGCNAYKLNTSSPYVTLESTGCISYTETWGPIPTDHEDYNVNNSTENYIPHNKDPNTYGRMPELHGKKFNFQNLNYFITNHWDVLRPCSDPNNPSYPCQGLGISPTEALSIKNSINNDNLMISISKDKLSFNTKTTHNHLSIKVYTISGIMINSITGKGNSLTLKWPKNILQSGGIYIYSIELDQDRFNRKFVLVE